MSLYITEDNLSLFFQSTKTDEHAQSTARKILRFLKDCWRVKREALDDLELLWTGKDRENENIYSLDKTFLVTVTLTAYLTPSWGQVRELSYLAISADTLEAITRYANQSISDDWDATKLPYIDNEVFVSNFEVYRSIPVLDNLLATISRACISTRLYSQESNRKKNPESGRKIQSQEEKSRVRKKNPESGITYVTSIEELGDQVLYRLDAAIAPDRHAYAREFVSLIYKIHKVGRKEPSSSFLRLSTRLDEQSYARGEEKERQDKFSMLWPIVKTEQTNSQLFVPVHSQNPSSVSVHPELCLFMTENLSIGDMIRSNKDLRLVPEWCFQAHRHDNNPGWGQGWNKTDTRANDKNLSEKITRLLSLCQGCRPFFDPVDTQSAKGKGPERSWKPKDDHTHVNLVSSVPMGLREMLELKDNYRSGGQRVTSIRYKGPRPTNRQSSSRAISMRSLVDSSAQPLKNAHGGPRKHARSLDDDLVSEDNTGSAYPRTHIIGQSTEHSNSTEKSIPPVLGSIGLPLGSDTNRSSNEETGEASSSSKAAQKRRRVDRDEQFTRDYLDQDELDQLLESGFFV